MTGKLPVSLVHAARVLQVLVSIVFVGKHLPTSVTFKALVRIWRKHRLKYVEFVGKPNRLKKSLHARGSGILTFSKSNYVVFFPGVFQGERDPEELHIAVSVPN